MAEEDILIEEEAVIDENAETLEEVLHQISEQTLRLAHIDEALHEIRQELQDGSEAAQTGLVELRGLVAARPEPQAASGTEGAAAAEWLATTLGDRFEQVERQAAQSGSRIGLVTILIAVQLLLTAAVLLVSLGVFGGNTNVPSASPALVTTPAPEPALDSASPAPAANQDKATPPTKQRKRRRH